MKKIIICLFVLSVWQVQAQDEGIERIPAGTKFIGGTLSLSFNKSTTEIPDVDDSRYSGTSFGIGPVAGKYFQDNVAIGFYLGYSFSESKNEHSDESETKSTYQSIGVGSFIRKNYKIIPNLFFFLQGQAGFSFGNNKYTDVSDNEFKSRSWNAGLSGCPGLQLFLGKRISLETTLGSVGYNFSVSKDLDSDSRSTGHHIGVSGGLGSIAFSVRYFIFP